MDQIDIRALFDTLVTTVTPAGVEQFRAIVNDEPSLWKFYEKTPDALRFLSALASTNHEGRDLAAQALSLRKEFKRVAASTHKKELVDLIGNKILTGHGCASVLAKADLIRNWFEDMRRQERSDVLSKPGVLSNLIEFSTLKDDVIAWIDGANKTERGVILAQHGVLHLLVKTVPPEKISYWIDGLGDFNRWTVMMGHGHLTYLVEAGLEAKVGRWLRSVNAEDYARMLTSCGTAGSAEVEQRLAPHLPQHLRPSADAPRPRGA